MIRLKHLVSIHQYANLCGVKVRAIKDRISKNYLAAIAIDGIHFIDATRFPAIADVRHLKDSEEEQAGFPASTDFSSLMSVKHYAEKLNIRGDDIYEKIILRKWQGIVIGDRVFVDTRKYPLHRYKKKKQLVPA